MSFRFVYTRRPNGHFCKREWYSWARWHWTCTNVTYYIVDIGAITLGFAIDRNDIYK